MSKLILKSEFKVVLKDKLKLLKILEKHNLKKKKTIIQIKNTSQFARSRQEQYRISLFSCFTVSRQKTMTTMEKKPASNFSSSPWKDFKWLDEGGFQKLKLERYQKKDTVKKMTDLKNKSHGFKTTNNRKVFHKERCQRPKLEKGN